LVLWFQVTSCRSSARAHDRRIWLDSPCKLVGEQFGVTLEIISGHPAPPA